MGMSQTARSHPVQTSVSGQADWRKETDHQVSETAKRDAMRPEGGYVELMNLTREGGRGMVFAQR